MNKATIIAGFAGIGKTTLANKYKNVIDLESSYYKYNIESTDISIEKSKGMKNRRKNPNWPQNYYDAIKEASKKYDIILVQLKPIHFDYFDSNNIEYVIAYPDLKNFEFIEKRCIKRGNNQDFISRLKEVFIPYYNDAMSRNYKKIYTITAKKSLEHHLLKDGYNLISK